MPRFVSLPPKPLCYICQSCTEPCTFIQDVYAYSGKVETQNATTSLECAGIVKRVGSEVSHLKEGDRVVVMAPGHFSTLESFPSWSCEKLEDNEDFNVTFWTLAFQPVVYIIILHANTRPDRLSLPSPLYSQQQSTLSPTAPISSAAKPY